MKNDFQFCFEVKIQPTAQGQPYKALIIDSKTKISRAMVVKSSSYSQNIKNHWQGTLFNKKGFRVDRLRSFHTFEKAISTMLSEVIIRTDFQKPVDLDFEDPSRPTDAMEGSI